MENDIIDSLSDIKYSGKLNVPENLEKAIKGGSKDVEYTKLVSYLSKELKSLYNLDEEVNPIQTAADSSAFLMELSSFLKEIGCPYESLTTGHLSDRLNNKYDKLLLLDYLLSELMAARMIKFSNPSDDKNELSLTLHETDTARDLKNLLVALQFNKPPPNITAPQLFQKVETKVRDTRSKCKNDLVGKPAFNGHLSEKQWENLSALQQKLHDEYTIRREMLIKRLDVTIQGFQWSERMKGKEATIQDIYKKHAASMTKVPEVDISDLLAARDDITIIEKTSSASVRKNTQTSINKVMIGSVPDRGGRPNEQEPPPPEMPSWQQRNTAGGGRGGGGGGRGGGGRGGGNQGGYAGGNQGGFSAGNQGGYGGGNQGGYGGGSQGGYGGGNQGGYAGGNQGGNRGNQGGHGGGNQGGYGGGNQGGYGSHGGGGGNRGQNYGGNRGGGNYNTYNQPVAGSYADQYVQDSARNQEYSNYNRGGGGGRGGGGSGRSNYNRGGYR